MNAGSKPMNEMIRLDNVSFGYKKAASTVKTAFYLSEITLDLFRGEAVVLAGRNGSGKTTLSKLMIGIFKPDKGDVFVDGYNLKKRTLAQTAKSAGYLFQNPERQLFCNTVLEEVMFSLRHTGIYQKDADQDAVQPALAEASAIEKAKSLLAQFSLSEKEASYPLKLSGGEKQRLALLTILAMELEYYILDEPSKGLDEGNREILIEILAGLKRAGKGLCIITHDAALAGSLADRRILMEKGRVVRDEKT